MHPEPILEFGSVQITLYGIFLALGVLSAILVLKIYTERKNIDQKVLDFSFFTGVAAIAGGFGFAALFQSIYHWIDTGVWRYDGITVMGGVIGGAAIFVVLYFVVGKYYFKNDDNLHIKQFNKIALVAPCSISVAHGIGRFGCLMAGCCHGAETDAAHGILMGTAGHQHYYVPTQLYEAIFLLLLFAVLSVLYFKNFNFTHVVYLIAYGIWRFVIEFFRADTGRGFTFLGLYPSQLQSIVFVLGGIALFVVLFLVLKKPFILPKEEVKKINTEEKQA